MLLFREEPTKLCFRNQKRQCSCLLEENKNSVNQCYQEKLMSKYQLRGEPPAMIPTEIFLISKSVTIRNDSFILQQTILRNVSMIA